MSARIPVAERLARRLVLTDNGCLEWTGSANKQGYGSIGVGGSGNTGPTHRVAWALANGPIPDGLDVLHHCDNPPCCQTEPTEGYPDGHLFLGTDFDNMADMVAKGRGNVGKTHCPSNHAYDEVNTYFDKNGGRSCKECSRIRCRKAQTLRRAARKAVAS